MSQTVKSASRGLALTALGVSLAACGDGGSDSDGEYFAQDRSDFATVVVEDGTVTYTEPQCEGENEDTAVGEVNEDRTLVVWVESDDSWTGDDAITFTETSVTISSNEGDPKDRPDVFVHEDSDAGKTAYAEHEEDCAEEAAAAEQAAENRTQMDADEKVREDEAAADEKAIESMTVTEMAECTGRSETYVKENQQLAELRGTPVSETPLGIALKSGGCLDEK